VATAEVAGAVPGTPKIQDWTKEDVRDTHETNVARTPVIM